MKKHSLMMMGAFAALMATTTVNAQTIERTISSEAYSRTMTTMAKPQRDVIQPQTPDADMYQLLQAYESLKPKPLETLTVKQARKQPTMADAVKKLVKEQGGKMPSKRDIEKDDSSYLTVSGDRLDMDIYYTKAKGKGEPRPVILYFHGGGFVIANRKVYESSILALARKTGAIVLAPEYRQAPDKRFPAAHEDAISAYKWAVDNVKEYNGDPARIAVVGESAGANLAANVGLMAPRNSLPAPVALGLIYPVAGTDMTTPSYQAYAHAKPLSKAGMEWFVDKLVRPENKAALMQDARLDLLRADVTGLPRTTVITAGIDPLRSEGEMLARMLQANNIPTTYRNYDGVTHEFFGADAVLADARLAQDELAADLNAAFAK